MPRIKCILSSRFDLDGNNKITLLFFVITPGLPVKSSLHHIAFDDFMACLAVPYFS